MCRSPVSTALVGMLLFSSLLLCGCSRLADTLALSPRKGSSHSPGALGMEYQDHTFPAPDGTLLHGWWVPGETGQPTVLLFHDGTGNVGERIDLLRQLHEWLGVGAFIFDYRGFGRSDGSPSDPGLAADTAAARQLVRSQGWDRAGLVLYGRGLGAALAAASAAESPPDAVVLEAAFPDLERLQRARRPLLGALLAPWFRGRFDTVGPVANLTTPVLFLHGDQDRSVPIGLGWQVYDACNAPKRFRTIAGANHSDTAFTGGELYWGAWKRLLGDVGRSSYTPTTAPP